jgi:hypothetical protein
VREALDSIAPDELRHAELSWAIDAWALGRLSPEARERVEAARREAWLALEREAEESTLSEAVARQVGLPSPELARRLVRELARSLPSSGMARAWGWAARPPAGGERGRALAGPSSAEVGR